MHTYITHSNSHSLSTMAKRLCSDPLDPKPDPTNSLLESFLSISHSSLNVSFDNLIESQPSDLNKIEMIQRAMRIGSELLEAAKRAERKRAVLENSVNWPLSADITIKIFSMMDTQSVCYAAATFSFFRTCAEDSSCYSTVDLVTESPKVNNLVVSTMIQRAGKVLRSLSLGIVPGRCMSVGGSQPHMNTIWNSAYASGYFSNDKRSRQGKETSILTRSCLSSLSRDGNAPGTLLRRLHLFNIERMDNAALGTALSACSSLRDLEIVGINIELRQTLESVSKHCHLIERLHFESSKTGRDDTLKLPTCSDLVSNCPHLTSLALKGFKLHDVNVRVLVKGFRKLKYVDFSTSFSITGSFLRKLGTCAGGNQLEVLILRDCVHLREVEVSRLLTAVVGGDFKLLRHLDISNREGLASEGDRYNRCYSTSFIPAEILLEGRPGLRLVADFPQEGSFAEMEISSSDYSATSSSQTSSQTMDEAFLTTSSNSSDPGSGTDDTEESSDEVDFLAASDSMA